MTNLTTKELEVLQTVKKYQNDNGHSDFISTDAKTKSVAGVISSLEKKGMVYDAYANDNVKYKMWCLTWDATEIVGVPSSWE